MSLSSGDRLSLGLNPLGPGGELRRGVPVPIAHKAAATAAEDPLRQLHVLLDHPTGVAGLRRWEPSVAHRQLAIEPSSLVSELASELPPADIADSPSQVSTGEKVGDLEISMASLLWVLASWLETS